MIWSLAREQMRSQRKTVAWTTALLTAIIALASFAAVTATTDRAQDVALRDLVTGGFDHVLATSTVTNGPIVDEDGEPWERDAAHPALVSDIYAQVTESATRHAQSTVVRLPFPAGERSAFVEGRQGDVDWEEIVREGRAPQPGEIVLSRELASLLGAQTGDTVRFAENVRVNFGSSDPKFEHREAEFTLVGYSLTDPYAGYGNVFIPDGYVAWEDAVELSETFSWVVGSNAQGEFTAEVTSEMWWDGPVPHIVTDNPGRIFYAPVSEVQHSAGWIVGDLALSTTSGVSGLLAVLTAFGTVLAGLAIARNQSPARTQWVATALTLGVPRRRVVAATGLEAAAVAAIAGTVGIALGWLTTFGFLRADAAQHPYSFHLTTPSVPGWLVAGAIVASLILAAIVIGAPGWWASRTSPVAALKPVTPLSEAEPSRRVPVRWLWWALAASTVVVLAASRTSLFVVWNGWTLDLIIHALALATFVVVATMLLTELLRWAIPAVAARIARLPRPWAVAASTQLHAARRQAVFPALAMTATVGALTMVIYEQTLTFPNGPSYGHLELHGFTLADFLDHVLYDPANAFGAMGALLFAGLLILVVGLTTASANRSQSATQSALGFTRRARVNASLAQHGVPMLMGTVVGAALGIVLPLLNWVTTAAAGNDPPIDRSIGANLEVLPFALVGAAWIALIALLVTALTACLIAFMTPQQTPVQALRDSEKAGIS